MIDTKLQSWSRNTIEKYELEKLLQTRSDAELYRLIEDAVFRGSLMPVKAAGTNGNRTYPVYLKYRIRKNDKQEDMQKEIELLHPAMLRSSYLQKHPNAYLMHRVALLRLNEYLFRSQHSVPVSKKERSFEIFDEEKQLEDRSLCTLLDKLGLTPDVLGYYETPEYCFHDYIPQRKDKMTLLICENKDIWFNIRRRMYEDNASVLFGVSIDGVVYGNGNKISMPGGLKSYTDFLGAGDVRYLYWGDIDREGFNIFLSVGRSNPGLVIKPFVEAYSEMIRLSEGRRIPDSTDHRERMGDYSELFACFPVELEAKLKEYIRENKRIPQEIISYQSLLHVMR